MRKLRLQERQLESSNLPLLELAKSLHGEVDLKDVHLIAQQHIVPTTFNLLLALFDLGLSPDRISLIGKCYSTDIETFERFKALGIDVCDSSHKFDSHLSFDSFYSRNLERFLGGCFVRLKSKKAKKVIILDDGGDLLIHAQKMIDSRVQFAGIEQTSSGYNKLINHGIKFPVINIARSRAKLEHETPIIIELSIRRLTTRITKLRRKVKNVLIIGGGVIGSAFFQALRKKYDVLVYDKNPEKSLLSFEQVEHALNTFDLIIGCVGEEVLGQEYLKRLKCGVILASVSSSDREFNAVHFRKQIQKVTDCHQDINVDGVCLLNCGFPLTFDSTYDPWDGPLLEKLQLTRSLILSGICQASTAFNSAPAFLELHERNQDEIISGFLSLYS